MRGEYSRQDAQGKQVSGSEKEANALVWQERRMLREYLG